MRKIKISALIIFLFLSILSLDVQCRSLPTKLVSNGVDNVESSEEDSLLLLNNEGEYCRQMYGFLPCSNNILGHLFLILVYQYLLFHGESYLAAGGEQVFKILGPGVFGASAFDILGALPESLILLGNVFNSQNINLFSCILFFNKY